MRYLWLLTVVTALACSRPLLDDPGAAGAAGAAGGGAGAGGEPVGAAGASGAGGGAGGSGAGGASSVMQAQLRARGATCARGEECASGFCVDAVCCNVACAGACVTCASPSALGTCTAIVLGAADPRAFCHAQSPASCGFDGTCDGLGACRSYDSAVECAPASCIDSLLRGPSMCDGKGACLAPPIAFRCEPLGCELGAVRCRAFCSGDGDCAASYVCLNGNCVPPPPPR